MIFIDCDKPKCCAECFALCHIRDGGSYDDEEFVCSFDINRKMPYGYFKTKIADDCPIKEVNKGE